MGCSQHGAGREQKVLGHDRQHAGPTRTRRHGTGHPGISRCRPHAFRGHVPQERAARIGIPDPKPNSQRQPGRHARLFAQMYCHGIASLAISEAYAMTGDYRLRRQWNGRCSLRSPLSTRLRAVGDTSRATRVTPANSAGS